MYLLGIDVGSSSVKASLVDANNGRIKGVVQYPLYEMAIVSRKNGWAEQQPDLWWRYICMATEKLMTLTRVDKYSVKAIGISYQMHGLVLINSKKEVLRDAIIWCDSRAVEIGDQAYRDLGIDRCLNLLLNSPGNFTATRLKWVQEFEPSIYKRIYKILLPGDYVVMKMTGQLSTTIQGLSEAILWDYLSHVPAHFLIDHLEISPDLIPDILPNIGLQGRLTDQAADQMGLIKGIPITYRSGDQPNNAMSLGVLHPGEAAATGGTSGVVYGVTDRTIYDSKGRVNAFAHTNYTPQDPRIGILLCINGGGSHYSWIRNNIASGLTYQDMEEMARTISPGSDGLTIMPFGNGAERMFNNTNLKGHLLNLQFHRHGPAHIFRAALEGIACAFTYGMEILGEVGLRIDTLRVGNDNLFQSSVFCDTLSAAAGCEIKVFDTTGAIGAAKAAGVGAGYYSSLEDAIHIKRPIKTFTPPAHRDNSLVYDQWRSTLEEILIIHNQPI